MEISIKEKREMEDGYTSSKKQLNYKKHIMPPDVFILRGD